MDFMKKSLVPNQEQGVRLFLFLFFSILSSGSLCAQVAVTATGGVNANYSTLFAAVTAINAGVHTGTIIVDVVAGHSENLSGRINLTATGTASNPITIQKSGGGANPVLIAYTGINTPASTERDGMFSLSGCDYVTINGIDLQEAAGNTDEITTMEYGYALFKVSGDDGCQYNTIKNCTITLNRVNNAVWQGSGGYTGSIGIAVLNCTATTNTVTTVTVAEGAHSFTNFYTTTLQNCNAGIVLDGFAAVAPFDLGDFSNDVGGASTATGNTILNYGGGAAATNFATGIFANNQWLLNCSNNIINNNNGAGINHLSRLISIFLNTGSVICSSNTIVVKGGGTTSNIIAIENAMAMATISNNIVSGEYLTATTGSLSGIYSTTTSGTINILNNTISDLLYSASMLTGSGTVYPIWNQGNATNVNVQGNVINNINRAGSTGGTTIGIYISSGLNQTVKLNSVTNMSIDGTGNVSSMIGIQTSTGTILVDSNLVNNLTCIKVTGTGALYGIYNIAAPVDENYNHNIVSNLTHNGTGTTYGIYIYRYGYASGFK
ncbi:MAG: hypothetical protein IPM98_06220 [Lewinellaceae bacterium]|nr:hypothetical protein [Lewinellaceae bacterium]